MGVKVTLMLFTIARKYFNRFMRKKLVMGKPFYNL